MAENRNVVERDGGSYGGNDNYRGGEGGGYRGGNNDDRERRDTGGGRMGGRRMYRRRACPFCQDKIDIIDFKDVKLLNRFVPERGKIQPRRNTGNCAIHQRMLSEAIKRARNIALLPFATD